MKNDIDCRLESLLLAHQEKPFEWGRFDCCQFVLAAAQALADRTTKVPAYRTERGAIRVLQKLGGYDGAVASLGGVVLPAPALAQRGDIVLVPGRGAFKQALAVCTGMVAHAPGPRGLSPIPMGHWLKAWRLECLK